MCECCVYLYFSFAFSFYLVSVVCHWNVIDDHFSPIELTERKSENVNTNACHRNLFSIWVFFSFEEDKKTNASAFVSSFGACVQMCKVIFFIYNMCAVLPLRCDTRWSYSMAHTHTLSLSLHLIPARTCRCLYICCMCHRYVVLILFPFKFIFIMWVTLKWLLLLLL